MKKHYKIYKIDDQVRQVVKVLATEKNYHQVVDEYGRCEELFENEVETMKKLGIEVVEDEVDVKERIRRMKKI